MKADCHIHMALDGVDWKASVKLRQEYPELIVHHTLALYRDYGYGYLRDGGDKWGFSYLAKTLSPRYGITYRTPLAPLCRKGHYGEFIGIGFDSVRDYARLVAEQKEKGADFVKIMASGLMDFHRFGVLTDTPMEPELLQELVRIAHEEGMPVMVHANGADAIRAAARAGVESVEHGAYADQDALQAMAEMGTVWVPTLSTLGNMLKEEWDPTSVSCADSFYLWWYACHRQAWKFCFAARSTAPGRSLEGRISPRASLGRNDIRITGVILSEGRMPGVEESVISKGGPLRVDNPPGCCAATPLYTRGASRGRFDRDVVKAILEGALENVAAFVKMGGRVAAGTDAGAWSVPHGCGTEEGYLFAAGLSQAEVERGNRAIREKF